MIEPARGWQAVQRRLDVTTNERHRRVLETLRDHLLAEATADFDLLLSTLSADPQYHFWVDGSGFGAGPKGLDEVRAHYETLYEERRHVCEYDIERIVADDDTVVTEGWFHQLYPGRVIESRGAVVDDVDAVYQLTMRVVLFWPFDADAKLTGEDSYSSGEMFAPDKIVKVSSDEVPEAFHTLV